MLETILDDSGDFKRAYKNVVHASQQLKQLNLLCQAVMFPIFATKPSLIRIDTQ